MLQTRYTATLIDPESKSPATWRTSAGNAAVTLNLCFVSSSWKNGEKARKSSETNN
jgi:hypothetical protein